MEILSPLNPIKRVETLYNRVPGFEPPQTHCVGELYAPWAYCLTAPPLMLKVPKSLGYLFEEFGELPLLEV